MVVTICIAPLQVDAATISATRRESQCQNMVKIFVGSTTDAASAWTLDLRERVHLYYGVVGCMGIVAQVFICQVPRQTKGCYKVHFS